MRKQNLRAGLCLALSFALLGVNVLRADEPDPNPNLNPNSNAETETETEEVNVQVPPPRIGLALLPHGRLFRRTFADLREIRMALSFEGDSRIDAAIGNYFSIFSIEPSDHAWTAHFGLEGAGYFTMRRADQRFPLETVDGLFGVYFEGVSGPWQAQFRYTHVSAHLADGSTQTAIAYSRETAFLRGAYVPDQSLQLYVGGSVIANTTPKVPGLGAQWGGSYFLNLGPGKLIPFVAADFKWKQESDFNPSIAAQFGIALNNPPEAWRSFRFFYSYYSGADLRGQYYNKSSTLHSIGIEMQI